MPEATLDQIAPGGVIQLGNAPAGLDDATFDSLFPAEPSQTQSAQQTTAKQDTQQTQQVQQTQSTTQTQTQQDQFFLKGDRSVYKTAEDAQRGINEKDAVIEQLRQRYALTTGIDPLTGKPVGINGQPQAEVDYSTQPDRYLDDLYNAAKKGGPEAYRDVQQKFILDTVKPLQPILQKAAKDQAIETLTTELPAAKGFVGSPSYTKALELNPEIKQAITVGETDSRFHSRLPGLFKLAYYAAQGMQLPELLKAQATQTQTTSQTQQVHGTPVRTTVSSTTPSPAAQTSRPSFKTIEGIRAIIADAEARGVKLDL
jgi:hypothetical protein